MGKHPNLGELDYLFKKGTDFRLSDRLYQEKNRSSSAKRKELHKAQFSSCKMG